MTTPLLLRRYPALVGRLPHVSLGAAPTPLRPLPLVSNPDAVWVKDESGYGDGGWGGNKVRKLEWILPHLEAQGRRRILSVGGIGTNWGLALARYATPRGFSVDLALVEQPRDEHVEQQLDRLKNSAARLFLTKSKTRTILAAPALYLRGHRTSFLPAGGSNAVGTLGAVEIALELAEQVRSGQAPHPTAVVTAVGSGGTVAGLLLGFALAGLETDVIGVVVNDTLRLDETAIIGLAHKSRSHLISHGAVGLPRLDPARLKLSTDWLGDGYGAPTPAGLRMVRRSAELGLAIEPVYTGKTLAAIESWTSPASLTASRVGLGEGPLVYLHTHGPVAEH